MAFFNKLFGKTDAAAQPGPVAQKQKTSPAPVGSAAKKQSQEGALPCDSWLALKGASKDSVVRGLGMTEVRACGWEEGIKAASRPEGFLFVTAPVEGCNLVIGHALPDLAYRSKAAAWITNLGAYCPAVYAFVMEKNVQVYGFAQVEDQALYRIYAVAQGSVRVNKGECSDGEEALNFKFPSNDDELFDPAGLTLPSEETIRALAAYWSVDPTKVVGSDGILGKIEKI